MNPLKNFINPPLVVMGCRTCSLRSRAEPRNHVLTTSAINDNGTHLAIGRDRARRVGRGHGPCPTLYIYN